MKKKSQSGSRPIASLTLLSAGIILIGAVVLPELSATTYTQGELVEKEVGFFEKKPEKPVLDTKAYDAKMRFLAHVDDAATTTASSTASSLWPVTDAPYPLPGALLPFNRIIAYYGNFYSTKMGVLGEYEKDIMLDKLRAEMKAWEEADPETPTIPAINYIAITAQGLPGKENLYMLRMPDSQIDYALELAKEIDGIVILDIQIGFSTLQKELPLLEKYLSMPNVHLGLDPEFMMKGTLPPGDEIGSYNATEINYAAEYLAELVKKHNLPPKVLIIHRFTHNMVKNAEDIQPLPEVQIVMDMDGWGFGAKKINTYKSVIYPEPVQFTGFKLFYKNDLKPPSTRLLTPQEILELTPSPSFIQYQ